MELPPWAEVRVEPAEFNQVVPTEYRADLVILLLDGKPILAIVVEVQLRPDKNKRESWPVYLTSLRSRVGCPVVLLVVAPKAAVARWCARPIELGHPGFVLRPLVLGPEAIPVIVDEQAAREDPEMAVLSAIAHGRKEEVGPAIARAVVSAAQGLDEERSSFYVDLTMASLSAAARRSLEELMKSGKYEYQTEFVRKWIVQGRQEGLEQGRLEGRLEGERTALLKVLRARGFKLDAVARQRIRECTQLVQLELWLRKAVTVRSVHELFESPPA
jgi:hypothetical protein